MSKLPCPRVGRRRKQVVDLLGISDESVRLAIAIRPTDFAEPAVSLVTGVIGVVREGSRVHVELSDKGLPIVVLEKPR